MVAEADITLGVKSVMRPLGWSLATLPAPRSPRGGPLLSAGQSGLQSASCAVTAAGTPLLVKDFTLVPLEIGRDRDM